MKGPWMDGKDLPILPAMTSDLQCIQQATEVWSPRCESQPLSFAVVCWGVSRLDPLWGTLAEGEQFHPQSRPLHMFFLYQQPSIYLHYNSWTDSTVNSYIFYILYILHIDCMVVVMFLSVCILFLSGIWYVLFICCYLSQFHCRNTSGFPCGDYRNDILCCSIVSGKPNVTNTQPSFLSQATYLTLIQEMQTCWLNEKCLCFHVIQENDHSSYLTASLHVHYQECDAEMEFSIC